MSTHGSTLAPFSTFFEFSKTSHGVSKSTKEDRAKRILGDAHYKCNTCFGGVSDESNKNVDITRIPYR